MLQTNSNTPMPKPSGISYQVPAPAVNHAGYGQTPCPSCGYCPTCGHSRTPGGYPAYPQLSEYWPHWDLPVYEPCYEIARGNTCSCPKANTNEEKSE